MWGLVVHANFRMIKDKAECYILAADAAFIPLINDATYSIREHRLEGGPSASHLLAIQRVVRQVFEAL